MTDYPAKRDFSRCPTHPGAILREDVLPFLDASEEEFAQALGVSLYRLKCILNERQPITSDVADNLNLALANGAEIWLRMQESYNAWHEALFDRVEELMHCKEDSSEEEELSRLVDLLEVYEDACIAAELPDEYAKRILDDGEDAVLVSAEYHQHSTALPFDYALRIIDHGEDVVFVCREYLKARPEAIPADKTLEMVLEEIAEILAGGDEVKKPIFAENYRLINPHPGEFLREEFAELCTERSAMAKAINVSEQLLDDLFNERIPVTPELSKKIGEYFGQSEGFWLGLQRNFDEMEVRRRAEDEEWAEERFKKAQLFHGKFPKLADAIQVSSLKKLLSKVTEENIPDVLDYLPEGDEKL